MITQILHCWEMGNVLSSFCFSVRNVECIHEEKKTWDSTYSLQTQPKCRSAHFMAYK